MSPRDLTPQQIKAYRLADNRSAEESSWDLELLPLEISELADLGYDLGLLGFDADELAKLGFIGTEGLTDPDEVPEAPEEPITRPGDLIILGNHRLLCGDATDPAQVRLLMAGERAGLMATDPPYLVDYDGGNHPQTWANGGKQAGRDVATKHWDAYTDHDAAVDFYQSYLAAALAEALSDRPLLYQWFAMMRSRGRPGGLAGERPAGPSGDHLAQEPRGAHPLRLPLRLRALPLRLDRRPAADREAAPAGRGHRRLGGGLVDRRRRGRHPSHPEAGRAASDGRSSGTQPPASRSTSPSPARARR